MPISSALGSSALIPSGLGFRNKIINGNFLHNQRGNASYTGSASIQWGLDRWWFYTTSGTVTFSQNTTIHPPGFPSSMAVNVTTGGTYSSGGNYCLLGQTIEAGNIGDLEWGSPNAKPVVMSFWVRSSITGTYTFSLQNHGVQNRSYVATYTIDAANTWEYKSIRIPGETSGTWNGISNSNFTNGGMIVGFSLGVDTNFQTSSVNQWSNTNAYGTASGVDLAATTGASFYIAGVQLEQNIQATPFENRDFGIERAMCQRYFVRLGSGDLNGSFYATTASMLFANLPVEMRTAPTATLPPAPWTNALLDYGVAFRTPSNLQTQLATSKTYAIVAFNGYSATYIPTTWYGGNFDLSAEIQ